MEISGIDAKLYIRRCLTHIPVGAAVAFVIMLGEIIGLSGMASLLSAVVGILAYWGFLKYELNEDRHIKDYAYPDIAGSIWGLILFMAGFAIWRL